MTEPIYKTWKEEEAARVRPCDQHPGIKRQAEYGWTGGTHYVCPRCRSTDFALDILSDALQKVYTDRTGIREDAVLMLAGAIRHMSHDQHWRRKWQQ